MRADGQTVGQAMDKDAAFLRSVGINAPDGALTIDEKLDAKKEEVRLRVLDALDEAFKSPEYPNGGWIDSDLNRLFRTLDWQTECVFNRARS
jgi:hypothetical protein